MLQNVTPEIFPPAVYYIGRAYNCNWYSARDNISIVHAITNSYRVFKQEESLI